MKKTFIIPVLFLMLAAFGARAQNQTVGFQDFLEQFPKATLPYSIGEQELQGQLLNKQVSKRKPLAWEYYEFLPELERSAQFSGMPVHPEPVAAFETADHYAVLYNLARGLSKTTRTYSISVFDKQGNYLGTHFVAGINPNELTAVTIDDQLKATVKAYTISWSKDFEQVGLEGNEIKTLHLIGTRVLDLATAGNPDRLEWANVEFSAGTADSTGLAR